jgi:hypothetical protein
LRYQRFRLVCIGAPEYGTPLRLNEAEVILAAVALTEIGTVDIRS